MNERRILPQRRRAETYELRHGNQNAVYSVTLGFYPDGTLGEVFVSGGKAGSGMEALCNDGATVLSIALQHGASVETLRRTVQREQNGSAQTIIGAVLDLIERVMRVEN